MTMTTTMTMKNDKLKRRRKKMIINYHVGGGGDGGRNQFLFFHQVEKNGHRFNIMVFFYFIKWYKWNKHQFCHRDLVLIIIIMQKKNVVFDQFSYLSLQFIVKHLICSSNSSRSSSGSYNFSFTHTHTHTHKNMTIFFIINEQFLIP